MLEFSFKSQELPIPEVTKHRNNFDQVRSKPSDADPKSLSKAIQYGQISPDPGPQLAVNQYHNNFHPALPPVSSYIYLP
ncbi:predicted protein [Sclerotinia sclerotiorum 1980 UF-70]|uniref:Uncharacterized protein n=1 Tax=Sclerotinia sclerotiorum (strain ATCC 18683 / 1980 / Ss-1) TaxID=665079 RepID=A7F5V5_SCLS1|nr:predicted protein [Sclerotinia sclerotiorum 1980 UF-70]EDN98126.1 predicted protein [Sclerotinia sclerotiorum 1980 UF-70]